MRISESSGAANQNLSPFFKEIKPTISLKNISLISILQNSCTE